MTMGWIIDFLLLPFRDTPAEKARKEGTLIYDEEADEWIEVPHE